MVQLKITKLNQSGRVMGLRHSFVHWNGWSYKLHIWCYFGYQLRYPKSKIITKGARPKLRDLCFTFWDSFYISETAEAANFKYGTQIDRRKYCRKCKIRSKWSWPMSRDLLYNSYPRLYLGNAWVYKPQIWFVDWLLGVLTKNAKFGQKDTILCHMT